MTFPIFLTILGPSIAFMITSMDPLLLSLNLTEISKDLGIPADLVGFTGSAATLVVAAAVVGVGDLGDIYGLKRLLMYGFMGSIVFEVLAALSPNYQFLIAMRLLDGLALTALVGPSLHSSRSQCQSRFFRSPSVSLRLSLQSSIYSGLHCY
jgi:MFS family permease